MTRKEFGEKIKPLDELFTLLYLFSPVVSGIIASLGLDLRLLWLPLVAFLFWTLYIYAYRAKYQLQDEEELSLVERARGLTYFFGLVATFTGNTCLFFFNTSLSNMVIAVILTLVLLFLIEQTVPRTFFKKQTALFTRDQRRMFSDALYNADNVSYYFSAIVVSLNSAILGSFPWNVYYALLFAPLGITLGILAYIQERKSRKLARNLAISLKGTRWLKHYLKKRN